MVNTMDLPILAAEAVTKLKTLYPDAVCSLSYGGDPWKLLVMARLSAQCTDARVNTVCTELFKVFPNTYALANADIQEVENLIRSCGLYHMKARDIVNMSIMLVNDFGGNVPKEMNDLLKLPGVGRKIANLMRGDVFGEPAVVTDTHCIRICGRLGFYPESIKDPRKIEMILAKVIEPCEQSDFCHRIVCFGRDICTARSPQCSRCELSSICKHFN